MARTSIKQTEALVHLNTTLNRFGANVALALYQVQTDLRATEQQVTQKLQKLNRALEQQQHIVASAERAYRACLAAANRQRQPTNCRRFETEIILAKTGMKKIETELVALNQLSRRLKIVSTAYTLHANRLQSLTNSHVADATHFLQEKFGYLNAYAASSPKTDGTALPSPASGSASFVVSAAPAVGGVYPLPLDPLGRPTGVHAIITKDMINTGSSATSKVTPPAFGGQAAKHHRGHLLAKELGGSGTDPRNIVTMHGYANQSYQGMRYWETLARSLAESGDTVHYTIVPVYRGNDPLAIGFNVNITVPGKLIYGSVINKPKST